MTVAENSGARLFLKTLACATLAPKLAQPCAGQCFGMGREICKVQVSEQASGVSYSDSAQKTVPEALKISPKG